MSKNININLELNGRLFPNWIMHNFKKYILPQIIRQDNEDPCNEKKLKGLTLYQEFIGQYLNYESPFRDILIYHGVGAGKTYSAINVYNILYNYTPKWNVFVLIPAALHDDPWMKDINKYLSKNNYDQRYNNIIFVHYDSPFADRDFLEKVKKADISKKTIFIIDEAHRFINNVYNNIYSKKGKRAQIIYDYIQQEKKDNSNIRIMLLSATPVINNPFEFALIFNLLRPGIFPSSESIFQQIFISSTNFASLNENTKNLFQRRIMGLVSYYIGATPDKFAEKNIHYVSLVMGKQQEETYNIFEEIEKKKEQAMMKYNRGKVGDTISTYSSYTRQACNFTFPNISEKVNGEKRPRPSGFKIKESDAIILDEGKNKTKIQNLTKSNVEISLYFKSINLFINELINYFKEINEKDKKKNNTIIDDINKYHKNYNGSFTDFYNNEKNKSKLFDEMYNCSPKFVRILFNIEKSKGTILIYSNYVDMEGLKILKIYLGFIGYIYITDDKEFSITTNKLKKDGKRFCEFHGGIEKEIRKIHKEVFNKSENKYGKFIKIIMISPAGAEGISLNNVRQVHIIEPYWNEVRIEQIIGRALRYCHHKDLPMDERKVDIFRYKMIRSNEKETTDEKLENISRKKNNLLLSFIDAVKEVAIDCELFKNHNMMGTKYKCFQFNEESLFEKPIAAAYQLNLDYDQKNNNGLNDINSNIEKIKVIKINAVIKLNDQTFSEEKNYWFNNDTGIVYDYELNYPIGKILKNDNDEYEKLDLNTFVIGETIDIPNYKIYN